MGGNSSSAKIIRREERTNGVLFIHEMHLDRSRGRELVSRLGVPRSISMWRSRRNRRCYFSQVAGYIQPSLTQSRL